MHSLELVFPVARRDTLLFIALKEHPVLICLIRPNQLCLLCKILLPQPRTLGLSALAVKEDIIGQGTVGQDSIEMEPFGAPTSNRETD